MLDQCAEWMAEAMPRAYGIEVRQGDIDFDCGEAAANLWIVPIFQVDAQCAADRALLGAQQYFGILAGSEESHDDRPGWWQCPSRAFPDGVARGGVEGCVEAVGGNFQLIGRVSYDEDGTPTRNYPEEYEAYVNPGGRGTTPDSCQ